MADFFDGRPVLITGVTGAQGTWLALVLARRGAQVIGVDRRQPGPGSHYTSSRVGEHVCFVEGDLRDVDLLCRLIDGVDVVFDLSAVSLAAERRAGRRDGDPGHAGSGSAGSGSAGSGSAGEGAAVLEAVHRSTRCERAVVVPAGDARPGLRRDGKHVVVARAGDVLLGGDPCSSAAAGGRGHLHVDCFESLIDGRPPRVADPTLARPYVYGLDIVRGYTMAAEQAHRPGVHGEVFAFGPSDALGVENGALATKICRAWGSGVRWESSPAAGEPGAVAPLDRSKAEQVLGWRPAYTIEQTVDDLARWFRVWGKRRAASATFPMDDIDGELIARYDAAVARLTVAATVR
jgi:CDP-glucose 4,6-dehydratase